MRHLLKACLSLTCILSVFLSLTFFASAQQSAMNYFADGVEAFDSASYQEAILSLKKAIELDPSNLEFQYFLGITYSAMERYDDALKVFESIVSKEPFTFRKTYFEIAALFSRQGKYQEVIDTLNRIEKIDPKNARIYLEKGYAYQRLQDYEKAIDNINKAKDLEPKLTQVAYYGIASVYFDAEKFDKAEQMFTQAIEVDPSTDTAKNARQSIINIKAARKARKPWYLSASLNYGYDDNVLQKPLEQAAVVSPTGKALDEGDEFQTLFLTGGYKFINRKDLEIGAGYSLYCTGYEDLVENNVLGHIPHLYLQYNNHPFYFRFQYDFSYYYTGGKENGQDKGLFLTFGNDSDDNLRMHSFMPTFTIVEPYNLNTVIALGYQDKEYLDGITPDASHYSGMIVQSYKIPNRQCYPRIGYKYANEDATEESSSYYYHQGLAGLSSSLFWGVWCDISITYEKTYFNRNPAISLDGKRRDSKYMGAISLMRDISDMFRLMFVYNYTNNDSNVTNDKMDPFEFEKNVYSLMITGRF